MVAIFGRLFAWVHLEKNQRDLSLPPNNKHNRGNKKQTENPITKTEHNKTN